jgi:hypothetical protein
MYIQFGIEKYLDMRIMFKYITRLLSHIKKEVILFDFKIHDEACNKDLYIECIHGENYTNGISYSILEGRNDQVEKGRQKSKSENSNAT